MAEHNYTADSIKSLDWKEHIRLRPGMYIGKLGDGSSEDDGIYVLLKEVLDNCIDEFVMGFGKQIDIECDGQNVVVRDHGRGIPLEKLLDCSSKINTGAKYDSKAFQKSVGLNGVGTKAVNALSNYFKVTAYREGKEKTAEVTLKSTNGNTELAAKEETVLGATLGKPSNDELKKLGITNGVKITSLAAGKLRAQGIQEGFIITSIDNQAVKSAEEVAEKLKTKKGGILIEGVYPNGMRAYFGFGL